MRKTIKDDLLYFALPGIIVYFIALLVCARDIGRIHGTLYILSVQSIVGLSIMVTGLTIMITAQVTLYRNYSSTLIIRDDHVLISHGIYRFIRHPIYCGAIILLCVGIPIYGSSFYGFLAMLAIIPIINNRITMEERMLINHFGDAYRTYMKSTNKFLPFI